MPHVYGSPHHHQLLLPTPAFDNMIRTMLVNNDARLRNAISHSHLNPKDKRQLLTFIDHIRVYRNVFMHTFVHLVLCCQSLSRLEQLLDFATTWKEWRSVEQVARHSLIKEPLLGFWRGSTCKQHEFLLAQRFVISDDDDDLRFLLLYCSRKLELYALSRKPPIPSFGMNLKESEQVIELLWKFLLKDNDNDVARRLRACIYRMARKSAYLPHDMQVRHPSISHQQPFGTGANGLLTCAKMNGRNVIIKKIRCADLATQKKCLEMFISEAILWGTLKHKNIVPFIGVVADGFSMGLVSPYFKNGNIKHYLKRFNRVDWLALAGRLGKDLADGLEYIHGHEPPIIHGDIKGDNVLVDDDGHACLGDFGQSHSTDSGKHLDSTRVGIAGYPMRWMAPEIMAGGDHAKASAKSDMYSFGCVLYEMVSGKVPFENHSSDLVQRVRDGVRPNRPASIRKDHPLWEVAQACWKTDPKGRPSAAELVLTNCWFVGGHHLS